MVKTANHPTTRTPAPTVQSYVARSFVSRVRSWAPLMAKVLLVLLTWTAAWFAVFETTATREIAAIAAIGFWFGWLFVAAALVFITAILLTGVLRDVRNPILA